MRYVLAVVMIGAGLVSGAGYAAAEGLDEYGYQDGFGSGGIDASFEDMSVGYTGITEISTAPGGAVTAHQDITSTVVGSAIPQGTGLPNAMVSNAAPLPMALPDARPMAFERMQRYNNNTARPSVISPNFNDPLKNRRKF